MRRVLICCAVQLLAGCASGPAPREAANDPAAPEAKAAEPVPVAEILLPGASALAALPGEPVQESEMPHHRHGGHEDRSPEGDQTEAAPEAPEPVHDYRQHRPEGDRSAAPKSDAAPGPGARVAPEPEQREAPQVFTCPMHPEVKSNEPGRCPKCGMKLVPRKKAAPAPTEDHEGHGPGGHP